MPKLSLHQITDLKSRKTIKEIVDGQQRSNTIFAFYEDELRLSSNLETTEIAGRTYSELDDEFKHKFIDYALSVDLFVAATEEDVREMFRRMNSYNVPLNPEEQRHARYQGDFKWFVHHLSRKFNEAFLTIGLFRPNAIVRMQDTKLITEVSHALLYGIQTWSKRKLDHLYRDKDKTFPEQAEIEGRITRALDQLVAWRALHQSAMMKPLVAYSLLLAVTHVREPVEALLGVFPTPGKAEFDEESVLANLTALGEALENEDEKGELSEFVSACANRTNTIEQRTTRFVWLCKALQGG